MMILLVVLWNFLALICWLVITVIQQKPSVKNKNFENEYTALLTTEILTKPVIKENVSSRRRTSPAVTETNNMSGPAKNNPISQVQECGYFENGSDDVSTGIKDDTCRRGMKEQSSHNNLNSVFSDRHFLKSFESNIEIDKFRSVINEDILDKRMQKDGVVHGLNKHINDSLKSWKEMEINIAITGYSGSGKSSLVNALRQLNPSDKDAAPVDVVEETISCCKYTYPGNPKVALWDLPGLGTQMFTKTEYLQKMDFARFDVVIIVTAGRFFENDVWLGKEVRALERNIIFVRTKIDIDVMNAKLDHPNTFNENECLAKIRRNLFDNIRDGEEENVVSGAYLVSSRERNMYDFVNLETELKGMLNIKGKAIRTLLQRQAERAIIEIQKLNLDDFKFRKIASVVYGFLPIPFLETGLSKLSVSRIRDISLRRFCIDERSLEKIANEMKATKANLKRHLTYYNKCELGDSLPDTTENKWPTFARYAKYIVPVSGSFWSAFKTYEVTSECLQKISYGMAEDECTLVNLRLAQLEENLKAI